MLHNTKPETTNSVRTLIRKCFRTDRTYFKTRPARKMAGSGRDDYCMQPISTQIVACHLILSLKLLNRCGR